MLLPQRGDLAARVYAAAENIYRAANELEEAAKYITDVDLHHPLVVEYAAMRQKLEHLAARSERIADTIKEHADAA